MGGLAMDISRTEIVSVNLNRAAHTAYFSNLRGTLDALLNVVLVPVPSWGRGLVGWLLWAPPPSVICPRHAAMIQSTGAPEPAT